MVKNQITVRLTPEQESYLNANLSDFGGKEIFNLLLQNYQNPPEVPQPDNSELTAEIERLKTENLKLTADNAALIDQREDLEGQITELENRQPETETVEVERQLAENEFVVSANEPHWSLLKETAKRMNTSESVILLDTFIRHTTDARDVWEYPNTIKKSEFESVCGHTHTQVKDYLKKVDAQ